MTKISGPPEPYSLVPPWLSSLLSSPRLLESMIPIKMVNFPQVNTQGSMSGRAGGEMRVGGGATRQSLGRPKTEEPLYPPA